MLKSEGAAISQSGKNLKSSKSISGLWKISCFFTNSGLKWNALKGHLVFSPRKRAQLPVFGKKLPQNVLIHSIQKHPGCATQRGSLLIKLLVWKSIYLSNLVKSSSVLDMYLCYHLSALLFECLVSFRGAQFGH